MITLEDLQAAIAECQGVKHPTAKTCIELAAFLTIREHLYGAEMAGESRTEPQEHRPGTVSAVTESAFSAAIDGKETASVLRVIDDLMQAVEVVCPRLYAATMRKLEET